MRAASSTRHKARPAGLSLANEARSNVSSSDATAFARGGGPRHTAKSVRCVNSHTTLLAVRLTTAPSSRHSFDSVSR